MTREETAKILFIVSKEYDVKGDVASRLDIWQDAFKNHSYEQINAALTMYIRSDIYGKAPHPGQLLAQLDNIAPVGLTEAEAWTMVQKAICRSNYYALEEYEKLPELIQRTVGSPATLRDWASSENLAQVKKDFGFLYRTELERAEYIRKMPENVRKLTQKIVKELEVDS